MTGDRDRPRPPSWGQIHPALQDILVRMDAQEVATLKEALAILMRLESVEIARVKAILKLVGIFVGIWRVIKWSVASFLGGLAAVALAGDQLLKIWGWMTKLLSGVIR